MQGLGPATALYVHTVQPAAGQAWSCSFVLVGTSAAGRAQGAAMGHCSSSAGTQLLLQPLAADQ